MVGVAAARPRLAIEEKRWIRGVCHHCGNFSYRNGHGTPVRFPLRTLEFKVQCGPPRPHPEQRRQASPSILPTAFVSHRRIESGWLAEFRSSDLPRLLRGSRVVVDVDQIRPGDEWRPCSIAS